MKQLTKEEIAHKILYSPVTNEQHIKSLEDGAKLIQEFADQQTASMYSEDQLIEAVRCSYSNGTQGFTFDENDYLKPKQ